MKTFLLIWLLLTLLMLTDCNNITSPDKYLQRRPWTNTYIIYGSFSNINCKILDIDMNNSGVIFTTNKPFTNQAIGLTRYGTMVISFDYSNLYTNNLTAIILTNNAISYSNTWIKSELNVSVSSDISE